jgi:hypothetical protein
MSPGEIGAFILKAKGSLVTWTGTTIFLALAALWNYFIAL